jgi:predicted TIM-barrel fold metal-dependent hydrolase
MAVYYEDYAPGNEEVRAAVAAHPDKLIGYVRANLHDEPKALGQVRTCFDEYGFRGLKIHPWQGDGFPTRGLMDLLGEYGRPLLLHTKPDLEAIDAIAHLARSHPKVPVIAGHMGGFSAFWPGFVKLCAVEAKQIDNLYLDTAFVFLHHWIRLAVDICGPEKVLFASDGPPRPSRHRHEANRAVPLHRFGERADPGGQRQAAPRPLGSPQARGNGRLVTSTSIIFIASQICSKLWNRFTRHSERDQARAEIDSRGVDRGST